LILIALMVVAFYFLIIRPNKKRQQAQLQTMNSLTPGTRVLLNSGIFGTLVEVGDKQAVVELSPGVHLTVLKQAIARAVREGDEDSINEDDESFDAFDTASQDTLHHDTLHPDTRDREPLGQNPLDQDVNHHTDDRAPQGGAELYRPGHDSDPRSGTNTTPIKD
jgi:preprotein translocase subunit YajC